MGRLFRSEEMDRVQLFLQAEAAYACVAEFGELGVIQLRDVNADLSAFQRKYVNEVRRCDEMERRLRFFAKEIKKDGIPVLSLGENVPAPPAQDVNKIEESLVNLETNLREINSNEDALNSDFVRLAEMKQVLKGAQKLFDRSQQHGGIDNPLFTQHHDIEGSQDTEEIALEKTGDPLHGTGRLGFFAGLMPRTKFAAFERVVWRATHGNVLVRQAGVVDPNEEELFGNDVPVEKVVFFLFFQGEQIKAKAKKICEGFQATLYPCPEDAAERTQIAVGIESRMAEMETVINQTLDQRHRVLVVIAQNLDTWSVKVRKIKAIYHTLNMFNIDVTARCLIGECWVPRKDMPAVQDALRRGMESCGSSAPSIATRLETSEVPPTCFHTNKFTQGFQAIVDAYGVADYREVNPAPFTIITFPFLFAVMFGDFGHGVIMTLFAAALVAWEKKLHAANIRDEIFRTFFGGRYIILLMGLFSIYCGLIYNECFSISFNIFGSSWQSIYDNDSLFHNTQLEMNPNDSFNGAPYPFGIDPIWFLAPDNKLVFLNSFKMKMSVILGVFHMIFGVVLSLFNHTYFKHKISIFTEFLPQLIFLCAIFFYLCFMIFYKWTNFGVFPYGTYPGPHCAPSLLIGMIGMFMFQSQPYLNATSGLDDPSGCYLYFWYPGQGGVQTFLVLLAILCVPVMLFGKPVSLYRENKRKSSTLPLTLRASANGNGGDKAGIFTDSERSLVSGGSSSDHESPLPKHDEPPFSFSEAMILQAIHTIEFCLGCISHTASYLRLWALSLAHAELSEVLWTMVMHNGLTISPGYGGSVAIFVIFAGFACLTLAILVMMEGLSAFLHALRLHWVEFNSKFYHGDGHAFLPFSFKVVEEEAKEAEDGT